MYLPEVENLVNARGAYTSILKAMSADGGPISQIWHMFAFRPEATDHLMRFTEAVMRGPSPLTSGMRELIAAYTSSCNRCAYCRNSHAGAAADLLGNEGLVYACFANLETAPLPEPEKALLRFTGKMTTAAHAVTEADILNLKTLGWGDDAIYDTITVCSLFNFYNRWVNASGVQPLPDEVHRQRGRSLARHGYLLQVGLPDSSAEPK